MRIGRAVQVGRSQNSLFLYGPNNVFARKLASSAPLASDQTPALRLVNQINYANPNFSWNGTDTAPSFYGYPTSGTYPRDMGWCGNNNGFQTTITFKDYTHPLYVVDSTVPNQKVTLVNQTSSGVGPPYTPASVGAQGNLQPFINSVPVPDPTKIAAGFSANSEQVSGALSAPGTDGPAIIWRPETDEMWEFWRFFYDPSQNGGVGGWTCQNGGYVPSVSNWSGIHTHVASSASGLASMGGAITLQDIADVLKGGSINHALSMVVCVNSPTGTLPCPPAIDNDHATHTTLFPYVNNDGVTPNLAAGNNGYQDYVTESNWFRLPASFDSSSMTGAGPIAKAIATAIRDYGLAIVDGGGNCHLKFEDTRVLGTPYSWAKVNPFGNLSGAAATYNPFTSYCNANVPSSWTDSSLPAVTEIFSGTNNVMQKIPWGQLEVLEPFSS